MIWINDQYINQEECISSSDRGLLLGDGFFETLKADKGQPIFFDLHWERLLKTAAILAIPIHYKAENILAAIMSLLKKNNLANQISRIRITVTRGKSESGIAIQSAARSTFIISVSAYTPITDIERIIISSIHRNELSPLSRIKSLNYLDNVLALQQAKNEKANDALMLNTKNYLACATTANVFLVKNNTIYTPHIHDGALPGIMRQYIFNKANVLNINIQEKSIAIDEIKTADEIFLTNSLMGIVSVLNYENVFFRKTLTDQLKKLFYKIP